MSKERKLLGVGLGAGLVGAMFVALKYAVRPPTKSPVPDAISPAIFRTKVLHTSLGQVVYHESGQGQPLLFLHGVSPGASSYEWSKVYPEFAVGHRVLAPDLIGFGESARPQAQIGAADLARAMAEFLRATCDHPAVLIGSGLGGGICTLIASQHPELISRLILLMPTGLTDSGRFSASTKIIGAIPLLNRFLYRNYQSTRASVRAWLTEFGFANPAKVTDEIVEVYTTCAQQFGAEHAMANLYAGRFSFDFEERLKTLTQPLTLLTTPHAAGVERYERFCSQARHCALIRLQQVGPLAALEDSGQIIAVLHEQLHRELRLV